MWRTSVVLCVAACTNSGSEVPDEGGAARSGKVSVLACTGGAAGDPTCPVNHVELEFTPTLRLTFVAEPIASELRLSHLFLSGADVHIGKLTLETWCTDCIRPFTTTVIGESIDVGDGISLTDVTLTAFARHSLEFSAEQIH